MQGGKFPIVSLMALFILCGLTVEVWAVPTVEFNSSSWSLSIDGSYKVLTISDAWIWAVNGDLNVDNAGNLNLTFDPINPTLDNLIRDAIFHGFGITMSINSESGQIMNTHHESIKTMASVIADSRVDPLISCTL